MNKMWFQNLFKRRKKVNLEIVKDAVINYRNDGKKLMFELGKKYDLNIENKEDYEKLISRGNSEIPRSGELSKKWNYSFHGGDCGFYNRKHQQEVEVVLSNSPEFGHIDSWFLLSYMQSTEKYKSEIEGVDWQELKLVIDKLYLDGKIQKVIE